MHTRPCRDSVFIADVRGDVISRCLLPGSYQAHTIMTQLLGKHRPGQQWKREETGGRLARAEPCAASATVSTN